jgi:hypothetical protein
VSELRVSDQDRERAIRELREHFAAGRLTEEELDERIQAAYAARTDDALQAVRTDLPRLPVTPAERRAELAERRSQLQRRVLHQSGAALVPFAICTGVWLAAGASGPFWPVWVLLFALIPLVRNGWSLYGPDPDLDAVERALARRRRQRRR